MSGIRHRTSDSLFGCGENSSGACRFVVADLDIGTLRMNIHDLEGEGLIQEGTAHDVFH